MTIRKEISLLFIILAMIFQINRALSNEGIEVKISAMPLIYDSFMNWTSQTPVAKIDNFNNKYANRGTVELILICKSFQAVDFNYNLTLIKSPNYVRSSMEVKEGNVDVCAEVLWEIDIDENELYITDPVILNGEYEKGIYVLPTNEDILKVQSVEELQKYCAVMPKSWQVDYQTLEAMKISKIYNPPRKEQIFTMLGNKRGDFTLLEFSNADDMSNELEGIKLIPVPNIKVGLTSSRHFCISKKTTNGEQIYKALNSGIKILRENGTIEKAYRESGFFNSRVKEWKKIN